MSHAISEFGPAHNPYEQAVKAEGYHVFPDAESFQASDEYHPVEKFTIREEYRENGALVREFDVVMDGGTKHEGIFAVPESGTPKVLKPSSVLRLGNTAWTTSVHGYSRDQQIEEAGIFGIPSVAIGTQLNLTRLGTMSQYGHNSIEVGKYVADKFEFTPNVFTASGDSRGAEITSAVTSFAHLHDVIAPYGDARALCGAEKIDLNLGGIAGFLWGLRNEVSGLKEVASHPASKLWRMRKTLNPHPLHVVQHAKDALPLSTNHASEIVHGYADQNQFLYVSIDGLDSLAKSKIWENGLTPDEFRNLMLDIYRGPDGSHLGSCASPRALNALMGRVVSIYSLINDIGSDTLAAQGANASSTLHDAAIQLQGTDFYRTANANKPLLSIVS